MASEVTLPHWQLEISNDQIVSATDERRSSETFSIHNIVCRRMTPKFMPSNQIKFSSSPNNLKPLLIKVNKKMLKTDTSLSQHSASQISPGKKIIIGKN